MANSGIISPGILDLYHINGHMSTHFYVFVYLPGNQMCFLGVFVQFPIYPAGASGALRDIVENNRSIR